MRQNQYNNNSSGGTTVVTYQNESGHTQYVGQSSYQPGAYQPYVQPQAYGQPEYGQGSYLPPPSTPAYVPAN